MPQKKSTISTDSHRRPLLKAPHSKIISKLNETEEQRAHRLKDAFSRSQRTGSG